MGILLTYDQFIKHIYSKGVDYDGAFKAQSLKVLDEIEKPCPHGYSDEPNYRKNCPFCMKEIRKELEAN